ncbi:MAG TPA: ThiF family adenylyltransferase [Phycisphaerales bacterium]|nr:ThiF family adenylyltransferase [Phycisphaerales bacterium]
MKKNNIIRFTTEDFNVLTNHLAKSGEDESFIFSLFSKAQSEDCTIYICKQLLLPDGNELKNQSCVSIEPDQKYQAIAYGLAYDQGLSIFDTHTHPFSSNARFSSIDDSYGIQNAKYIATNFPEKTTMGMIVFGSGFDNFEARIWNRDMGQFEPVNRIEVLGSPTKILTGNKKPVPLKADDPYARHRIIPGWEQGLLENLKVFVCGLGGNGALIFDSLLALGIGSRDGWIKACDPDILETSNLPRIPYAYPEEVGTPKAEIAQLHADNRTPELNVSCYDESIEDEKMQNLIKEANIIIGAIDNDGARLILNGLAARYVIPYLDLGTEIIPDGSRYEAIGQVQTFIPGKTGCLVCSGAIDPSEAALDTMSEEDNAQYEQAGYVRGTNETPTPSVLHLNGVTSHLAISQLIRLIFDDGHKGKEYLHYNSQDAKMFTAAVARNDDCPVCGLQGYLGAGDEDAQSMLECLNDLQDSEAFNQI